MSAVAKKRTRKPKAPAKHPKYADMIIAAMKGMKEQGGTSRQKIVKYIGNNYKVGNGFEVQVRLAIKRMLLAGLLIQARGTGAAGSFRLAVKATAATKKRQNGAKRPLKKRGARKPKRAAKTTSKKKAKKATAGKKRKSLSKKRSPAKKPRTQSKRKAPKKSGRKASK